MKRQRKWLKFLSKTETLLKKVPAKGVKLNAL